MAALAPTRQVDIQVSRREVGHLLWQSEGYVESPQPRSRLRKRAFTRAVSHNHTTRHATATAVSEALADGGLCSEDDEAEFYDVEAILDERVQGGEHAYLVKWEGYGPDYNTWEPPGNLAACSVFLAHVRSKRARTHHHHATDATAAPSPGQGGGCSDSEDDPDFNEADMLIGGGGYDDGLEEEDVVDAPGPHRGRSRGGRPGGSPSKRHLPKTTTLVHTALSTPLKATRPGNTALANSRVAVFNVLKTGCFTPVRKRAGSSSDGGGNGGVHHVDHTPRRLVLDSPARAAPRLTGSRAKPRLHPAPDTDTPGSTFRRQLQRQIASRVVHGATSTSTPASTASARAGGHTQHAAHPRKIVFVDSHAAVREPALVSPGPASPRTATSTPLPSMPATPNNNNNTQPLRPAHCDGSCHHTNCLCDPNR